MNVQISGSYSDKSKKKIYLILAFFLAILWLAGGKKGLNSAIGLVFTFVCIIWIFLPLITLRVFCAKKVLNK